MLPLEIKLHGSLMVIAWMFCCTNGIILSRHYKYTWPRRQFNGLAVWFILHQVFNSLTIITSILATIVIVYYVRGYSHLGPAPFAAHPVCGFMATALALLNPLAALCRCHPTNSNRWLFNWIHSLLGLLAISLAIPTTAIGLIMHNRSLTNERAHKILICYEMFVVAYIITEVALEIIDYNRLLRKRQEIISERLTKRSEMTIEEIGNTAVDLVKEYIYYAYFSISLILTVAIVAQLAST